MAEPAIGVRRQVRSHVAIVTPKAAIVVLLGACPDRGVHVGRHARPCRLSQASRPGAAGESGSFGFPNGRLGPPFLVPLSGRYLP